MRILLSITLMLFAAPSIYSAEGGNVPTPGQPVVSPPFGPGLCVVACVPEATGGGGGGNVNLPGGAGGGINGGGGKSGGQCFLFCNPNPLKDDEGKEEGTGGGDQ